MEQALNNTTIVAIATPHGRGGIAVIRLSGPDAINIADKVWRGKGLNECKSHTIHLGDIISPDGEILDNAVASIFRSPTSFTGEDTVEFSVHASPWIQREVLNALIASGATPAGPGEFSQRAFTNGKIDLAQAEGIGELIAAESGAAHRLAMRQTKGEYSRQINTLRDKMIYFASMLELELDFSEEDVEFANRKQLTDLCLEIEGYVSHLADSYKAGKVFKEGVPTVIAGIPNVGKSTLLNNLLGDDRAIVSSIPGTTRDIIEDTVEINGILFRLFDTAGLRDSEDEIERAGIELAYKKLSTSALILCMIDPLYPLQEQLVIYNQLKEHRESDVAIITIISKADTVDNATLLKLREEIKKQTGEDVTDISVREGKGIEELKHAMSAAISADFDPTTEIIITNARHYAELEATRESIRRAKEGIESGLTADFIAQDIREAIHHLTTITGAITTDTLLATIFSTFCIGK
ncbi:MAG: tRNA uridine-5-carboxymethylaminomethyl(34) synthesis GTPase MnmE [Muribaculaceae bacterium]|nr:tRNA uridine-5-carboxymethylaminomethyl(34) synthesis GTPase MnmE [Muribaculaceae bacterium]